MGIKEKNKSQKNVYSPTNKMSALKKLPERRHLMISNRLEGLHS